jgi:hypothetical protein
MNSRTATSNRFVDLAEKRVGKALKDIKLIGNLSNRSNYEYSSEDSVKIIKALKKAVDDCKLRFEQGGKEEDEVFTL